MCVMEEVFFFLITAKHNTKLHGIFAMELTPSSREQSTTYMICVSEHPQCSHSRICSLQW